MHFLRFLHGLRRNCHPERDPTVKTRPESKNLAFPPLLLVAHLALLTALSSSAQQLHFTVAPEPAVEAHLKAVVNKNSDREALLEDQFKTAGCEGAQLAEAPVKGSKLQNVVCTLPGASDDVIVVGAHFDHVSAGLGVVDNWSGATLLPLFYESLRQQPHRHTFRFIGFADEEKGLVGSRWYVHELSEQQRQKIAAMINLDTLGLSSTKVWLTHSDKDLADALSRIANSMNLPLGVVNVDNHILRGSRFTPLPRKLCLSYTVPATISPPSTWTTTTIPTAWSPPILLTLTRSGPCRHNHPQTLPRALPTRGACYP